SDNVDALLGLVAAHESRGDFAQAEQAGLRAVALRPEFWTTHSRLALLYSRWGRFDRAVECWRRVVALVPDHKFDHANLGAALFHLGQFDEAITSYRTSLRIHRQATALVGLGTALFFTGQVSEAMEMFGKAVEVRPRDPRTWMNLGDAQR